MWCPEALWNDYVFLVGHQFRLVVAGMNPLRFDKHQSRVLWQRLKQHHWQIIPEHCYQHWQYMYQDNIVIDTWQYQDNTVLNTDNSRTTMPWTLDHNRTALSSTIDNTRTTAINTDHPRKHCQQHRWVPGQQCKPLPKLNFFMARMYDHTPEQILEQYGQLRAGRQICFNRICTALWASCRLLIEGFSTLYSQKCKYRNVFIITMHVTWSFTLRSNLHQVWAK